MPIFKGTANDSPCSWAEGWVDRNLLSSVKTQLESIAKYKSKREPLTSDSQKSEPEMITGSAAEVGNARRRLLRLLIIYNRPELG